MSEQLNDPLLDAFKAGKLFAYPTEAVYGLGCDPDNEQAVERLLSIKKRPRCKGVILVASNYTQVLKYVKDNAIPPDRRADIFSSWPGPVTWLLPKSALAPAWITGDSSFIAVRVSAHPRVQQLCERFSSPLVSTSANVAGEPPATTSEQVANQFADQVILIDGELGGNPLPSTIKNSLTGQIVRKG